jgi:TetR/AcrR family transcriptional regulator, fatty acid metabolism regulator protein
MNEVTARRRQAEREERISTILKAARTIFYQNGYTGTTIRKIAYEAELSQGAIYHFFKGIDEIYAELLLDQFKLIDVALEKGKAEGESLVGKIKCIFRRYFDYYLDYPESYDLFLFSNAGWRRVGLNPEIIARLDEAMGRSLSCIEAVISEGMESGEIKRGNTAKTAYLLWMAIEGIIVVHRRNLLENSGWDIRDLVERQMEILLEGITVP